MHRIYSLGLLNTYDSLETFSIKHEPPPIRPFFGKIHESAMFCAISFTHQHQIGKAFFLNGRTNFLFKKNAKKEVVEKLLLLRGLTQNIKLNFPRFPKVATPMVYNDEVEISLRSLRVGLSVPGKPALTS